MATFITLPQLIIHMIMERLEYADIFFLCEAYPHLKKDSYYLNIIEKSRKYKYPYFSSLPRLKEALITRKVRINKKTAEQAVYTGNLDILKFLMKLDVKFNGIKTISNALDNGHIDIVKYLVGRNYDNIRGVANYIYDIAKRRGYLELLKYFNEIGIQGTYSFDTTEILGWSS